MDNGHLPAYRTFDVPVTGGTLRCGIWGVSGPVLLCSHGITAKHIEFQALADPLAGECRIVAPDHRGRGRSHHIEGPWGMAAHAADVTAVLDHLKLPRADVLVGHSMGGFVAAVTAARYPHRIGNVLMVDGGIPLLNARVITWLPFSNFITERLTQRIIGPSLTRLGMTFESRNAYRDFWRVHPALAADWSSYVEQYVDYDLEGEPPALRASVKRDALLLDVQTQLIEDLVPQSLKAIRCPIRFLRAERGVMNGPALYDERRLRRATAKLKSFSSATVDGVNHFTIMISERGAKAVAAEIRTLLKQDPLLSVY
jgi:lipase